MQELLRCLLNKQSQITYDVAEGDPDSANAGVNQESAQETITNNYHELHML